MGTDEGSFQTIGAMTKKAIFLVATPLISEGWGTCSKPQKMSVAVGHVHKGVDSQVMLEFYDLKFTPVEMLA